MKKIKASGHQLLQKLSSLLTLVFFIFIILFVSIVLSACISAFLISINAFPPLSTSRFFFFAAFILVVSLLIGTVLALLGGDYFLQPLRNLTEATKKIAEGDFEIEVETYGTREVTLLSKNFNKMAKELASIDKLRDDFVSNISHEYKTPIVSIRGFARQLKKNNLDQETRNQYLDIIITESERLLNMSNNVLLFSKIENASLFIEHQKFSLDEQIRRSILIFEPQINAKKLQVNLDLSEVTVFANEELLQHVWTNLLGNAIKFTPESKDISIKLSVEKTNAVIEVIDTGDGLSEEVKLHLFEKFYQGDTARAASGNGLGLALAKNIVTLHNGEIRADNFINGGARFVVELPLNLI